MLFVLMLVLTIDPAALRRASGELRLRPMRIAEPLSTDASVLRSTALRWPSAGQFWPRAGYATMALAVVLVGLPMYWMVLAAFKTNQEIFTLAADVDPARADARQLSRPPGSRRRSASSTSTA